MTALAIDLTSRPAARAVAGASVERLVTWRMVSAGLWSGQIGADFAGLVDLQDSDFVVTDWRGDTVGAFHDLEDAQLSLEPETRAAQRDAAAHSRLRTDLLLNLAISAGVLSLAVGAFGVAALTF